MPSSGPFSAVRRSLDHAHRKRLTELHSVLTTHQEFWRPAPFRVRRPDWCAHRPDLTEAVLALDEPTLDRLTDDPDLSRRWLARWLPDITTLTHLVTLPPLAGRDLPSTDPRLCRTIPGRKYEQVKAFAAQVPASHTPVLDWCAGKGHLGRLLAHLDRRPVQSLEIDAELAESAARLATRMGVDQTIIRADARSEAAHRHVTGRAVVALHACGELHRSLVRRARRAGAHSYSIAPCCYHVGTGGSYQSLAGHAPTLPLDTDALRLATTETVTAPPHDRARLARDQTWKLGFIALRDCVEGEAVRRLRPVPARWLSGDFSSFCRALADREGVNLPASVDWAYWLAVGGRRRDEVRRLELVRHAFRRPLELWLVMDLAAALEEAGFDVRVGSFCDRSHTPRNLMLQAQR
ncbi:methyltransferase [Actinopolymorpha singaporensis]|uniref:Methyltransferase domain-containing protein n=1 Tax=Actinopolymorpha singaporensis TaxID=117157 RepID=A0A1H1RF88_9ACTN|nr:methyltransferase [Actinopolymorpha singaporensis]SDS34350.1 Methyltransferase domain-containing protein [Actinopolymorpha singaporensis]